MQIPWGPMGAPHAQTWGRQTKRPPPQTKSNNQNMPKWKTCSRLYKKQFQKRSKHSEMVQNYQTIAGKHQIGGARFARAPNLVV